MVNNPTEIVTVSQPELDSDVNIQCVQSSEFVVGKQANFNGPVTLINCVDTPEEGSPDIKTEHNKEKIIIRDKVLTQKSEENVSKQKESGDKIQNKLLRKLKKGLLIPALFCAGLIVAVVIALIVFFVLTPTGRTGEQAEGLKIGSHAFYTKKDWKGKPPRSTIEMKLPIPYAVISHSVTTQCFHLKACSVLIQNMQDYHMTLDFADIGYNFLIDSSGNIYEGRGWNFRNVKGGFVNGRNIDIALIGDYSESGHPTKELMQGLKDLLEFGVENGKLSQTYSLIAANSTYATLSPGKNVYDVIATWPHFDPDPKSHVKEFDV